MKVSYKIFILLMLGGIELFLYFLFYYFRKIFRKFGRMYTTVITCPIFLNCFKFLDNVICIYYNTTIIKSNIYKSCITVLTAGLQCIYNNTIIVLLTFDNLLLIKP